MSKSGKNEGPYPRINHLANERSLYLKQHAHNPIDWHPWSAEAFQKAEREDRPLLLSIGYSACHWCHVMARESFEDEYVASLLNRFFVCVKVDREERPDIDSIYMAACQLMTGGGGWPLTLVITPDRRPFFAATYLPKGGSPGSPGLVDIMTQVDSHWKLDRKPLMQTADQVLGALRRFAERRESRPIQENVSDQAYRRLADSFDDVNGGFEIAPKFPSPHRLLFLLRYHRSTGERQALDMATATLSRMREGGLYDHVGFGFHRYSTDARWHLPHFEKMLYDQAMQVVAYTEAYHVTQDERWKRTALEVLAYVEREMTSPFGGFYSAESADSEGEEGRYYVWTWKELDSMLSPKDMKIMVDAFGITKDGNFREEATRRRTGANLLHLVRSVSELAKDHGMSDEQVSASLSRSLSRAFDARESRQHPDKDDKVLTDWNGLMIAASARAARVLGYPRALDSARRAANLISHHLMPDGRLRHRMVGTEVAIDGFLDDHACFAWGLMELFAATGERGYLAQAEGLVDVMSQRFWDERSGGFYQTAEEAKDVLVRMKESHDGAMPSGNSVAAFVLAELARLTGKKEYAERGVRTVQAFAEDVESNPAAHAFMLCAYHDLKARPE